MARSAHLPNFPPVRRWPQACWCRQLPTAAEAETEKRCCGCLHLMVGRRDNVARDCAGRVGCARAARAHRGVATGVCVCLHVFPDPRQARRTAPIRQAVSSHRGKGERRRHFKVSAVVHGSDPPWPEPACGSESGRGRAGQREARGLGCKEGFQAGSICWHPLRAGL